MHLPYSALTGLFDQLRQPSKSSQPTNNVGRQIKTKLPTNVREIPGGTAGTAATIAEMQRLAREASTDPHWVSWCRTVVSDLPSKDYEAEARRIYDVVKKNVRYVLDPRGLELVQDPRYIMFVDGSGDCFAEGTLLLKDDHTFVCVSKIKEGDRIWGRDKWTAVTKTWNKGYLPTWKITLNNGSSVRLTPDHKVWVSTPNGDMVKKISELTLDDILIQPSHIDYGSEVMDEDFAYIEGLYLSDGWSEGTRFAISGKDGHKKEEQKLEVAKWCDKLGINYRWHERYISVIDKVIATYLSTLGKHAPEKRARSIAYTKNAADKLLAGIMADAGAGGGGTRQVGRCLTTTSRDLARQARILLRQQGISASERYVEDHGGLGKNPIWRITTRTTNKIKLKVKKIDQDNLVVPCYDLATEDQQIYLPEADWVVHNCDEHSTLIAAMALSLGHEAAFKTIAADPDRPEEFSHVYPLIGIQKGAETWWYSADTTQPGGYFGWEPPKEAVLKEKVWPV